MNYKVYQGTELKQTVTSKTAVMNGLQPNRTYEFGVEPDNTQTVGGRTRYTHVAYANMTHIANERNSFTLSERATVRFGAGNNWVYKTLDAGTYTASSSTFGIDPYVGMGKYADVVSDFSVGQGSNKTYIGWYSDFTEADSNDPIQYTWNRNAITSVTTRGIRFNIPKTLTVGSTITLRYEEYPLGIVPIGNEPSGMFGGGNKQNLSATVISTANGSSVVEVGGNVIEVGGYNLLTNTNKDISITSNTTDGWPSWVNIDTGFSFEHSKTYTFSTEANNSTSKVSEASIRVFEVSTNTQVGIYAFPADGKRNSVTFTIPNDSHDYHLLLYAGHAGIIPGVDITTTYHHPKLEPGTIATPYASFVDGDTFTAQPDGTCALFSEYKALYY